MDRRRFIQLPFLATAGYVAGRRPVLVEAGAQQPYPRVEKLSDIPGFKNRIADVVQLPGISALKDAPKLATPVRWIILHHTATAPSPLAPHAAEIGFTTDGVDVARKASWAQPPYHIVINPNEVVPGADGRAYAAAELVWQLDLHTSHARVKRHPQAGADTGKRLDDSAIGIAYIGGLTDPATLPVIHTLVLTSAVLAKRFGLAEGAIFGHGEVDAKDDPWAVDMHWLRQEVARINTMSRHRGAHQTY